MKHHQIQPNIILTKFHYKPTPRSLNFITFNLVFVQAQARIQASKKVVGTATRKRTVHCFFLNFIKALDITSAYRRQRWIRALVQRVSFHCAFISRFFGNRKHLVNFKTHLFFNSFHQYVCTSIMKNSLLIGSFVQKLNKLK